MAHSDLQPISRLEERRRLRRVIKIARQLGFVGPIEYRQVLSRTGGAQYGIGNSADQDLLVVFARAFERDADPDDFSLEAMIAHERGHQLIIRDPKLRRFAEKQQTFASEEILASLIGSVIAEDAHDREVLHGKALFDAMLRGLESSHATRLLHELRLLLEITL